MLLSLIKVSRKAANLYVSLKSVQRFWLEFRIRVHLDTYSIMLR